MLLYTQENHASLNSNLIPCLPFGMLVTFRVTGVVGMLSPAQLTAVTVTV